MLASTALGFPGENSRAAEQPAQSPIPPRAADESTQDRISRLEREIAKAEGRVYLGDPLKHPVTNEVTVKPCGTPQPDPWAFVISAKESARAETARMIASPKPESERMSEEARNLARMGMPLGDNPYEMQTEAREKWSGRGFSPGRGKRQDSAGGQAPENNKALHLEWAKIQSIQPRLRLKPDEVKKYEMYKVRFCSPPRATAGGAAWAPGSDRNSRRPCPVLPCVPAPPSAGHTVLQGGCIR